MNIHLNSNTFHYKACYTDTLRQTHFHYNSNNFILIQINLTISSVKGEKLRKSYIEDEVEAKIEKLRFLTEDRCERQ